MNLKVELKKKFPKANPETIDSIAELFIEFLYTKREEFKTKVQKSKLESAAYNLDLYYDASKGLPPSWMRLFLDWLKKDVRNGPDMS